jgi:AraC-like DNA-binding protein
MIMQYIHTNYARQITLDELATIVSLSKSSVLELFKKNLHISPINYLIEYRLKWAAKLILDTEKSISAIAADTGFENIGYFCRKFKSLFGMSPSEYRKVRNQI